MSSDRSGEMSSGKSGEISSGKSGEMSSGRSGEMSSDRSGEMSSGKSGEMSSGKSGQMSSGRSGEMSRRKSVQMFAAVAANLGQAAIGQCAFTSAFLLPQLQSGEDDLHLTEEEGSWFASMLLVGSLTGSLMGGWQADFLGRRLSMMADCILLASGVLVVSQARCPAVLLMGRFLSGHGLGSNTVSVPIFVSEISHPDFRGTLGTLTVLFFTSGACIQLLLGALVPWRWAVGLSAVVPLLSIVLLIFVDESPSWLLRKDLRDKTFSALMFYRGDKAVATLEMERCQANIDKDRKKKEAIGPFLHQRIKHQIGRMLRPEFLKPFLFINLMLNIGLECTGFPILSYYMHTLLNKLNIPMDAYFLSVCIIAYRAFLIFILSFIMKSARRRPVYLLSGCLVAFGHMVLATYMFVAPTLPASIKHWTDWTPLIAYLVIYTGFGLGYGPLVFVLQGELLPAELRSAGCGLIGLTNNIFLFTAVKTGPAFINNIGMSGTFCIYAIVTILTLIVAFFTMPETKGMSLEDIEDFYAHKQITSKTREQNCVKNTSQE